MVAQKRPKRRGGSSNNPSQQEKRMDRPFPLLLDSGMRGKEINLNN